MRTVHVPLDDRTYPIRVGSGALSELGALWRKTRLGKRCAIITDTNVAPVYAESVESALKAAGGTASTLVVPAGERTKDLRQVHRLYDQLAQARLERSSVIVALGGGVIGDLAGFVAATYLRGIDFVQIPTTLLAQVDSSVGGKTGVNLKAGKNLVGAFYQPKFVLCDLDTLRTLPEREYKAGLAEVIKYGIIHDSRLFSRLERDCAAILNRDPKVMEGVVAQCCRIKADVVGQDEKETGLRAILNFGHTIGHALEAISAYNRFLHGEAISIGQVAAARLSQQTAGMPEAHTHRIQTLFQNAGLPVSVKLNNSQMTRLFQAMRLDKKVTGGEIKFVLSPKIGKAIWGQRVSEAAIRKALAP